MKILISLAFIVIFISAFFIMFTSSAMGERYFVCDGSGEDVACSVGNLDGGFTFGVSFIFFFILLIFFTMFVTYKSLKQEMDS